MEQKPLENKVANKAIIQLDPQTLLIEESKLAGFDLKPFLFKELLLKEKDFRERLSSFDFSVFQDKSVFIYCSSDAIIPMWAYMLVSSFLSDVTDSFIFAKDKEEAEEVFLLKNIKEMEVESFQNKRIIIKGCGDKKWSPNIYTALVQALQPVAKSIMFGESCSMIPVYRKK